MAEAIDTVCIGDIHGQLANFIALWERVKDTLGEERLARAQVIFLGDYCDRGPDTRGVLDALITLRDSRAENTTHFISGNHDFAFACYIGCVDWSTSQGLDLDGTKPPQYVKGFWKHPVPGGMHYQGRRWGGGDGSDVYDARSTFESYGVRYDTDVATRENLQHAVPESHKEFLRNLKWVHTQALTGTVVCTHSPVSDLTWCMVGICRRFRSLHTCWWPCMRACTARSL